MNKREELARAAHATWSAWAKKVMEGLEPLRMYGIDGEKSPLLFPRALINTWNNIISSQFADLPLEEQEAYLAVADQILEIVEGAGEPEP